VLPYPADPAQLPAEFVGLPHFVAWRWAWRDGRWTKPPVDPRTGATAEANDPATWGSFAEAVAYARAHRLPGIGVEMAPDMGLVAVDLDACRESRTRTGRIAPWALDVVRRLGTLTQVSPTGTGLRLFVRGRIPAHLLAGGREGRRRGPVEVYQGGHYLTLTTARVPGTPGRIEARQAELEAWLAELFPAAARESARPAVAPAGPVPLGDDVLLEVMFASKSGARIRRLWGGDLSAHDGDHSRADAALCTHLAWWTDRDGPRMDRLFRRSRLARAKWDREDYRARTVALAVAAVTKGYRGPAPGGAVEQKADGTLVRRLPEPRRPRGVVLPTPECPSGVPLGASSPAAPAPGGRP
jgi:primase-polymerase (primpol)-like protein